ncbi:MAG TPA: hypothetical protein LFV92_03470 [Rickettsia endosymbiont of Ceroptres masudai]|nr:hypothetical protein [Rickettsia endosymbiont of Ceroptres masudai]
MILKAKDDFSYLNNDFKTPKDYGEICAEVTSVFVKYNAYSRMELGLIPIKKHSDSEIQLIEPNISQIEINDTTEETDFVSEILGRHME